MEKRTKMAYDLAHNEIEEKQIQNLKNIIKNLLQKKSELDKEKDEIEEKIKLVKQNIDDFKAGRLDKIKERYDLNPKAKEIAPIKVVIINDSRRTQYPFKPQFWNYEAIWVNQTYSGSSLIDVCGTSGTNYATFTSGAYEIGNKIINL
jgi:hypothetical protein